ncbi:MAG TPA: DUF6456 domain-containing protein [Stellaceae bacterium]|nr:DUF6456 domain-containing protein [Stellaceae bacterium]
MIEAVPRPIADDSGAISRPLRSIDILASMERRGVITSQMRQAGEDFRNTFRRASLDPLKSQNLLRARAGNPDGPSFGAIAARERVWHALTAVGGIGSAGGSCLWHVVGGELSLKEWALSTGWSGRRVSQEAASGILISALGTLAQHFHLIPGGASRN